MINIYDSPVELWVRNFNGLSHHHNYWPSFWGYSAQYIWPMHLGISNTYWYLCTHCCSISWPEILRDLVSHFKWRLYIKGCTKPHILKSIVPAGSAFIKLDQLDPWIKDQIGNTLLSTILHLQLPNFVSCGRDKPSHMTQNLVTVGAKL